jgi:hypothetical protein
MNKQYEISQRKAVAVLSTSLTAIAISSIFAFPGNSNLKFSAKRI